MLASKRNLIAVLWVIVLLTGCQHGGPSLRIERPLVSSVEPLAVAAPWRPQYEAALQSLGIAGGLVRETPSPDAAVAAVRDGSGRFALTEQRLTGDLPAAVFDTRAVALVVPLTFAVEDVTEAQARQLASGALRDWRDVGGPAQAVRLTVAPGSDRETLAAALGANPLVSAGEDAAPLTKGSLRFELSDRLNAGEKALTVGGLLPDAAEYPLVSRRVLVSRAADAADAEALARRLSADLTVRRGRPVVLDAVGDIMLGRSLTPLMAERGPAYPLAAVQPLFAGSDLRFGNLELALTQRGTPARKDYVFRAPPEPAVAALVAAGFNVLSLANNHLTDYGADGVTDTIQALQAAGIRGAGAGPDAAAAHAPVIVTLQGLRIAFLAYVNVPDDSVSGFRAQSMAAAAGRPGVAWGSAEAIRRDVTSARAVADLVIVSMHAGYEYTPTPNAIQRELARAAVESGAALVLGGHPHVLQGLEYYRGIPVINSLGNFVFDLDDDDRRQPGLPSVLSVVMRVTFDRQGVRSIRFMPVIIDARDGRPTPATGADARRVLERLYRLTDALAAP